MIKVISLKSFGDFLIPFIILSRIIRDNNVDYPKMIAGEYIKPLLDALPKNSVDVSFVAYKNLKDVPAIYNIKKSSFIDIIKSIFFIKKFLYFSDKKSKYVVDRLGLRERFLLFGLDSVALPEAVKNIYLAYEYLFKNHGFQFKNINYPMPNNICTISIFPESRVRRKMIPDSQVSSIAKIARNYGVAVNVVSFQGDNSYSNSDAYESVKIPKNFNSLLDCINQSDIVISADSLPGHLSEYFQKPIFIVSPSVNLYWLPKSSFLTNAHSTFENLKPLDDWFNTFLREPK